MDDASTKTPLELGSEAQATNPSESAARKKRSLLDIFDEAFENCPPEAWSDLENLNDIDREIDEALGVGGDTESKRD